MPLHGDPPDADHVIVSATCRLFPDERCLFESTRYRDRGTCAVCKNVAAWAQSQARYVMVREIRHGRGLYVFPVSTASPTAEDRQQCILQLRIADAPLQEIRRAVNIYLLASEESWIHEHNQCLRVR